MSVSETVEPITKTDMLKFLEMIGINIDWSRVDQNE